MSPVPSPALSQPETAPLPAFMQGSALPRTLDFSVASNRYAAGGLLAGVAAALLLRRRPVEALGAGLAGFSAWAAARELDPDHVGTASAALPLAVGAALLGGVPNPLASFSAVSGLRVLAATVGHRPTGRDVWSLGAQAVLTGLMGERVAAALPGAALALSARQADDWSAPPESALSLGAAALPALHQAKRHSVVSDLVCLAALGTFGTLDRPETVTSTCDQVPRTVSGDRVQLARQLALGTLTAGLALRQTRSLTPLAAAVLSVGWRRAGGK